MKKRKIKVFNLLILIALCCALLFGGYKLIKFGIDFFTNHHDNPDPNIVEKVDKFTMELVDYEVYKVEEVDFNFALVRFRISDKDKVYYSLGDLYTDEKIKCNDNQSYIKKLESKSYYLGSKNVDFQISSDEKSGIFKIFVPILDKNKENLTLYDVVSKKEFTIDLDKNIVDENTLKYETGNTIENNGYKMSVADAYVERKLMTNDGMYEYPSTVQVYAFALNIEDVTQEGLRIEDAVFEMENGNTVNATGEIFSMKLNNAINSVVRKNDKLGLFFEVINPGNSNSFAGKLKIKFSNSDEWLTIETELD